MAGKASAENGKKGGRPKGSKDPETLMREKVLEDFRQKAMQSADVLFNAQLTLARGQTYLYRIEKEVIIGPRGGKSYKNKRPELVTEKWEIEEYLQGLIEDGDKDDDSDGKSVYYFLTTKDPDNKAIDSMLDRSLGKPVQPLSGDKDNPLTLKVVLYDRDNNSLQLDTRETPATSTGK